MPMAASMVPLRSIGGSLWWFWRRGRRAERAGYLVGTLLLVSGLLHLAALVIGGGSWEGPLSLRKAVTFGLSFGLTLITIVWVASFVRRDGGRGVHDRQGHAARVCWRPAGRLCHRRHAQADACGDHACHPGASGAGLAAVVCQLERATPTAGGAAGRVRLRRNRRAGRSEERRWPGAVANASRAGRAFRAR